MRQIGCRKPTFAALQSHIALLDGRSYREPAHDNYATYFVPRTPTTREVATYRGEFWELRP